VLVDTGSDGEDVRIEDNVLGIEIEAFAQQRVAACADLAAPLQRVRLTLLVEGHHHTAAP
jgi:hypothetical protein